MNRHQRNNQQTAAASNRRLVIELLRRMGPLSQSQLTELTGLRGSTLSYITRELLAADIVIDGGQRPSKTVGKKQRFLQINPNFGWAIGMELTRGKARLIAIDASGQQLGTAELSDWRALEELPQMLHAFLPSLAQQIQRDTDQLLGIGIGISGIVDAPRGRLVRSTMFDSADLDLAGIFHEAIGVPILVDHNANLAALAENRVGAAREHSHFVQIVMNPSIEGEVVRFGAFGAALFLDGRLYRGVHSAAGEMDSGMAPLGVPNGTQKDLDCLTDEEAPLTDMLSELAKRLAHSVGHVVNLLDTSLVVLSASTPLRNAAFVHAVNAELSEKLIPIADRETRLVCSRLNPWSVGIGGAMAAIESTLLDQPLQQVLAMDPAVRMPATPGEE